MCQVLSLSRDTLANLNNTCLLAASLLITLSKVESAGKARILNVFLKYFSLQTMMGGTVHGRLGSYVYVFKIQDLLQNELSTDLLAAFVGKMKIQISLL